MRFSNHISVFARVLSVIAAFATAKADVAVNGASLVSPSAGEGWGYTNAILTLSGPGPFTISGSNLDGDVQIVSATSTTVVAHDLVLDYTSAGKTACPFAVGAGCALELKLVGSSIFNGSRGSAINLGKGARLTVSSVDANGVGAMIANASGDGAAIAATDGLVEILGGVVHAYGGGRSAGIGGGRRKAGGTVKILGGTVVALGKDGAPAIGGGLSATDHGTLEIDGGSLFMDGGSGCVPRNRDGDALVAVVVTNLASASRVMVAGLAEYGVSDIVPQTLDSDGENVGRVCLWMPKNSRDVYFDVNGVPMKAYVEETDTYAVPAGAKLGVCVDDIDISRGSGDGWTFSRPLLAINRPGDYVLSGTNATMSLTVGGVKNAELFCDRPSLGDLRLVGPLTFAGGTVAATAMNGAVTILGGSLRCGAFDCAPSNRSERVWCVTVTNLTPNASVALTGLGDYRVDGIVADADGRICLWLPDGDLAFSANGVLMRAIVDGADCFAEVLPSDVTLTGVKVRGIDAAYGFGPGWRFSAGRLTLDGEGPFELSGANTRGEVLVAVSNDCTVIMTELELAATANNASVFEVAPGVAAEVVLRGTNVLVSGVMAPGIGVPVGAFLRIDADSACGLLRVTGGQYAAGIGSGIAVSAGSIVFAGGTVFAQAGQLGNDVGTGLAGDASHLSVTVTGGSLTAPTINVQPMDDGSRPVHCVTVGGLAPNQPAKLIQLPGYATRGIVADDAGEVRLYLPDGEYFFGVGLARYRALVDGAAVTATRLADVAAPTALIIR